MISSLLSWPIYLQQGPPFPYQEELNVINSSSNMIIRAFASNLKQCLKCCLSCYCYDMGELEWEGYNRYLCKRALMVIGNGGKLNVIKVKITQLVLYYCVLIIIAFQNYQYSAASSSLSFFNQNETPTVYSLQSFYVLSVTCRFLNIGVNHDNSNFTSQVSNYVFEKVHS